MLAIAAPLLNWFDQHAADLPWRHTRDPYTVWLSEVMLQQTRIETVIPYYRRFIKTYPTIQRLAEASLDEVLKQWEGLGYYSRARNLHRTAQIIARERGGRFPQTVEGLLKLPGVGRYTAGAIASIAYGTRAPVMDGNVMRVFSRLYDLPDDITQAAVKKRLWEMAEAHLPEKRPGDYNQALMELGQRICTPRAPQCPACPLAALCRARAAGTQEQRPVRSKRAPVPHYPVTAGIIRRAEDERILIAQRPADGLLGGLWEFPGGKQEPGESLPECLQRELREELAIEVEVGRLFVKVRHAFTHFKITLHAYECRYRGPTPPNREPQLLGAQAIAWITLEEMDGYSFGKADRQIIAALRERGSMLL